MCQLCGSKSPEELEERRQQLLREEDERIARFGYTVRQVFPGADEAGHGYYYTMGRSLQGLPELLFTGAVEPRLAMSVISAAIELDPAELVDGATVFDKVMVGYGVRIVEVIDTEAAGMYGAERVANGEDFTALQLVWPDAEGRFPGDPDFTYGNACPVFGVWRG